MNKLLIGATVGALTALAVVVGRESARALSGDRLSKPLTPAQRRRQAAAKAAARAAKKK
jgi:hypothetical protein